MAFANFHTQEIHCKIVYFGAPGAGKTSNLRTLLERTTESVRNGEYMLKPPAQPGPFFEFLPLSVGYFRDHHLKVHIYSMPQDHLYTTFPSVILKGVDGFVFVVDSALERLSASLKAWQDTQSMLHREGIVMADLPSVIQYNKRDLRSAMPVAVMTEAINRLAIPEIEASATTGEGVMESLQTVVEQFVSELSYLPS